MLGRLLSRVIFLSPIKVGLKTLPWTSKCIRIQQFNTSTLHMKQQNAYGTNIKFYNKIKDSILVFEAKQGVFGKSAVALSQSAIVACATYASGSLIYHIFNTFSPVAGSGADTPGVADNNVILFLGGDSPNTYARDRILTAYMYMLNSLGISALAALTSFRIFRNTKVLNTVASNPILAIGGAMGSQFLITMLIKYLPYHEGFGAKQAASILQAILIGLSAAPLYLMGAQSSLRAGYLAAGATLGLTALSHRLPHDTFNSWGGPLSVGMYAAFLSFLALWFVPRHHILYKMLYKTCMHGGLVVFPAHYLYSSKILVQSAYSTNFDPINSSISMYTDVLNIYGRLAFLLPPHYLIFGGSRSITNTLSTGAQKNNSE